ncbi:pilin [Montanilutibacter psychrotolerans]|uniref:Uncharacterized protein n=1 Tax=Montanilutibacter psychrotolerans TaxID=1327343 RepID=A0A3M8SXQ6_9GAMM|nr:pilin [Lysobacter psychrotolerans]RNF86097.1 hypothetical protein EER27_01285 [Lysobacter psychrotolerans]
MNPRVLMVWMGVLFVVLVGYNGVLWLTSSKAEAAPEAAPVAQNDDSLVSPLEREAMANDARVTEIARKNLEGAIRKDQLADAVALPLDRAFNLRDSVMSYYASNSEWPYSFDQMHTSADQWKGGANEIDLGAGGRIRVSFGEPFVSGSSITLAPSDGPGLVTWNCSVMGDAEFQDLIKDYLKRKNDCTM